MLKPSPSLLASTRLLLASCQVSGDALERLFLYCRSRKLDPLKVKIESDQVPNGPWSPLNPRTLLRRIGARLWGAGRTRIRPVCARFGRALVKRPLARAIAVRVLNRFPGLKRRVVAMLLGVPLRDVVTFSTSMRLASNDSAALSRTATEAYRLLKQQRDS